MSMQNQGSAPSRNNFSTGAMSAKTPAPQKAISDTVPCNPVGAMPGSKAIPGFSGKGLLPGKV